MVPVLQRQRFRIPFPRLRLAGDDSGTTFSVIPSRSEAEGKGLHSVEPDRGSPSLAALAGDDTRPVMAGPNAAFHAAGAATVQRRLWPSFMDDPWDGSPVIPACRGGRNGGGTGRSGMPPAAVLWLALSKRRLRQGRQRAAQIVRL